MVNAFRYGFFGVSDVPVWICFSVLIAFMLIFTTIVVILFRRGMGVKN